MCKFKKIIKSQSGMQTIEVLALCVIALIFVALIFNGTKDGIDASAGKIGNTLNIIGTSVPDQLNP